MELAPNPRYSGDSFGGGLRSPSASSCQYFVTVDCDIFFMKNLKTTVLLLNKQIVDYGTLQP